MDLVSRLVRCNRLNTILFASSSPFDEKKVKKFLEFIGKWGKIKVDIEKSDTECFIENHDLYNYLYEPNSGKVLERFLSLITDPEIHIIWCIRGGYGIYRWLSELMRHHSIAFPKTIPLIVGFSDVTYLHLWAIKLGYQSLHAPLVTTLEDASDKTHEYLYRFFDEGRLYAYSGKAIKPTRVEGMVVGGNLSCLVSTIGTFLEPDWRDRILFIEDHNEAPYRIDRMLTHLKNRDVFNKIKALCVGEFYYRGSRLDMGRVIETSLNGVDIPIVYDLPIGHGSDNFPLLMGGRYLVDGDCLIPVI